MHDRHRKHADADLVQRLKVGDRKELGHAPEIASAIRRGELSLDSLMRALEDNARDHALVSHGMHALRTATEANEAWATEAIAWLLARQALFDQWEAQEQLCRLVVEQPLTPSPALVRRLFELYRGDKAIVSAYALEALINLSSRKRSLAPRVQRLLREAHEHPKAAVRARARKLHKRLPAA